MKTDASETVLPSHSRAFLLSAFLFLCAGVGLGLYMAIAHDYSLTPVHAHTNLLGWVTSAIFGLVYGQMRLLIHPRLVWIQFVIYTVGVVVMMTGLAGMISGQEKIGFLIAPGTALTLAGILLFGWILLKRT